MREEKNRPQTNPQMLMIGYLCVKELKALPEKVNVLGRFQLNDGEIALICDCAVQSVRDARQKIKKKKGLKTG